MYLATTKRDSGPRRARPDGDGNPGDRAGRCEEADRSSVGTLSIDGVCDRGRHACMFRARERRGPVSFAVTRAHSLKQDATIFLPCLPARYRTDAPIPRAEKCCLRPPEYLLKRWLASAGTSAAHSTEPCPVHAVIRCTGPESPSARRNSKRSGSCTALARRRRPPWILRRIRRRISPACLAPRRRHRIRSEARDSRIGHIPRVSLGILPVRRRARVMAVFEYQWCFRRGAIYGPRFPVYDGADYDHGR